MKRKIKTPDDYIPMDCWKEAKEFFLSIRDDVDIYKKFKCFQNLKQSEEADKFIAWWEMERFADYPLSLILIYENLDEINTKIGIKTTVTYFTLPNQPLAGLLRKVTVENIKNDVVLIYSGKIR